MTASTVDDAEPAVGWRELYSSLPETSAAFDAKVELRPLAPSGSAREYFQEWGILPSSTPVVASSDLDTIEPTLSAGSLATSLGRMIGFVASTPLRRQAKSLSTPLKYNAALRRPLKTSSPPLLSPMTEIYRDLPPSSPRYGSSVGISSAESSWSTRTISGSQDARRQAKILSTPMKQVSLAKTSATPPNPPPPPAPEPDSWVKACLYRVIRLLEEDALGRTTRIAFGSVEFVTHELEPPAVMGAMAAQISRWRVPLLPTHVTLP